ncbi:hypothetical protein Tco_0542506 [Tanacetum coccineum]
MLIPNAFLTEEIHATNDYKEYETMFVNIVVPMNQPQPIVSNHGTHRSTPRSHRTPTLTTASLLGKKRKQSTGETSLPQKLLKVTINHKQMVKGEKDVELYVDEFVDSMLNDDVDDSGTWIEPGSHKENPEVVNDNDVNDKQKQDESKDDNVEKMDDVVEEKRNDDQTNHKLVRTHAMGSVETRNEHMQTPIPTPTRSPRKYLSSNKIISEELTVLVSPTTATSSKTKSKRGFTSNKTKVLLGSIAGMCRRHGEICTYIKTKFVTREFVMGKTREIPSTTTSSKDTDKKRHISNKYNHLPGALRKMCRRQGYMIWDMERKCVTTDEFWKVHEKVDQVLHKIIPQLAERATNDLIKSNLKPIVADTFIQERDDFQDAVSTLISKEFDAQAPYIIEELFKKYVQRNVIQVYPTITISTDTTSSADLQQQLDDDFHSQHHNDHQDDDAPPKGEKRMKRHKTSKRSKSVRGSSSKQSAKDTTTYVSKKQQEWDAWEEETVIDEDENGNTKEKKYILSLHKIHVELFPEVDMEEKMNR